MRMSDWVATAEAMPVRLTSLFQFLSRGIGLVGLVGCVLLAPIALAERGSHITLDEPLPQPSWELPLIANGEGTVTDSTYLGRVTYVDFWASWCGPCRRENPNVVRAWNEYKDRGFDVFSISLDRDVSKWKRAIDQDGLAWPYHISDLKGWSSVVSTLYGVSSIPHAILIDADGTVVATHLRGNQLERELEKLL